MCHPQFFPALANSNFPGDSKQDCGMFNGKLNQKYSNIPPVSWGKDNNPTEKVYFLGRYNKPPATPAAVKVKSSIKFLTLSVFCYKVDVGERKKKVSRHPLKTCRSHFNAEIGVSGLASEVTTSGSHDGRETWRDLLTKANQKT